MHHLIGEPGSKQRQKVAASLVLGSPCLALLLSFSVIAVSRFLADPIGWYAFDPVMAANGVLAVLGSMTGGMLRRGPKTLGVVRAIVSGIFAAITYALAIISLDALTNLI